MPEDQTRALLELLYHVSREVATALDLRTVLQRVLYEAIENVGGERGTIVVLDDTGKPVDATIVHGKQFHDHTTQQLRDTVERGLAGWVVRNRKAALIPDTSRDERWLKRPDDENEKTGSKSAICVPLLARERLVGVLTLVHSLPNAFGPEHLELMQAIADQAGIAVLNAHLYTESQRQARVMTALAEGAAAINTSLRLDDVLQQTLTQTMHALQVETVALALMDPTNGELIFRAAAGQNAGNILNRHIPAGEGLAGIVVREGRGVVVPDVSTDSRFEAVDRFGGIETRTLAIAPIRAQNQVIGILEAVNPVSGSFDPDSLLVMNGIGSLAGANIQNAQLFERLNAAHQRYRELFETSTDPILITDWNGIILEANREAVLSSEYTDEELRGLNIERLHALNWEKTGQEFEHLKTYGACTYESQLHQKNGNFIPVQVNVRSVDFEETDMLQWTLHDISERNALDDLRNDLMAMVYHDLRSPLANIISSLDMLGGMINAEENEAVQSILTIASNSTTRVERLVNSLLDINRLESGQKIINQRSIALSTLLSKAIDEVKPLANNRDQQIKTRIPEDLSPVWVDEDMVLRVLINLLENASKFAPAQGKIKVTARSKKEWIQVEVYDDGPGIPAVYHKRIFDKFAQLRGKDKPGGLGIGLAFCKIIVEGHGGNIWVKSEAGKGITFFFTLPIATAKQRTKRKAASS
jgi:two-component system, NtrC family, sensor histidine kinase KinB